jgi:hypothetical protein
MKAKQLKQNLILKKETIAHLDKKTLESSRGGATRLSCDEYTVCPVLTCFVSICIICP